MKIIMLGCGKLGDYLVARLLNEGHQITVISETLDWEESGRDPRLQVVVGNPVDDDLLVGAGIAKAQAILCVTPDEHLNLMLAQIAKQVHHIPYALAEITDPKLEQFCLQNGISTVCPLQAAAERITALLAEVDPVGVKNSSTG
jgi:trk system potassium uptake protein TrkA